MRYYEEHSDVTIKTVGHKFENFAKRQINSKIEVAADVQVYLIVYQLIYMKRTARFFAQ